MHTQQSNIGIVNITNSNFTNGITRKHGLLYMGNGSIYLNDIRFINNIAQDGNGSVIYIQEQGTVDVINGKFYNNVANDSGTIYVGVGMNTFYLTNVEFLNNNATLGDGSVLYVPTSLSNSVVSLNIKSSDFTNNIAGNTGTIYFNGDILTMNDGSFNNNLAQNGYASAIYMPKTTGRL